MPARVLERILRADRGRLLAALIARTGDFQRAEDALQEAAASALIHWGRSGLPARPEGWLLRVALRKAIDGYRRARRAEDQAAAMALLAEEEAKVADALDEGAEIPDERLRLIFTCCHPALEAKTQVALTLRTLCGLSTAEVAAAFLDAEPTMGQRLSRGRAKIARAGIAFRVPGPEEWPARLGAVLATIYLIYTTGYRQRQACGRDLCAEAIFLARLLNDLAPDQVAVEGCLSLLLVTQSRALARVSPEGETVPPTAQDRSLWSPALWREAMAWLERAVARRQPEPFQIKAAIAFAQMERPPAWAEALRLYEALLIHEPTPVVRLNRAVVLAETGDVAGALDEVEALTLSDYQPWHAVRADLLARLGRGGESRRAYAQAIALASDPADVSFLIKRQAALPA